MTEMRTEEIFKLAAKKWGKTSQLIVALEELSELQVEIAKHLNGKRPDISGLVDELADVRIMVGQIEHHFKCGHLVAARKGFKLEKLLQMVNEPGKDHPVRSR